MTSTEAEARVGTWIRDKYRIDHVLGEGGMAVVYAATHKNKKRFALKMLRRAMSGHEETRARFVREGYVANTVAHPAAVAVLDEDVADDGSAFLVMELLEGENLETIARAAGGRLGEAPVLGVALRVLDALAAAHARGIVHRDIKPANLFVTHEGELKILDFGIARLRDAAGQRSTVAITQTGAAMMGTPAYMAPEQALGKASLIDPRTDVWAVGATMFSLLSGRHVHEGETLQELLVLTATRAPASIADVVPGMDPRVAEVVDGALRLDRDARWGSAAVMRDAVAAAHLAVFGAPVPPSALHGLAAAGAARAPASPRDDLSPASPLLAPTALSPVAAPSPAAAIARRSPSATASLPAHELAGVDLAPLVAAPAGAGRSSPGDGAGEHGRAPPAAFATPAALAATAPSGGLAPSPFGGTPAPRAVPLDAGAYAHFPGVTPDLAGPAPPARSETPEGRGGAAWLALFVAVGFGSWIVARNVAGLTKPRAAPAAHVDAAAPPPATIGSAIDDAASASADPRGSGPPPSFAASAARPRPFAPARPASSAHPRSSAPSPFDHQ